MPRGVKAGPDGVKIMTEAVTVDVPMDAFMMVQDTGLRRIVFEGTAEALEPVVAFVREWAAGPGELGDLRNLLIEWIKVRHYPSRERMASGENTARLDELEALLVALVERVEGEG